MLDICSKRNTGLVVLAVFCVCSAGLITGRFPLSVAQEGASSGETLETGDLEEKDRSELQNILRSKLKRLNDLQTQTFEARQDMNRNIREATSGKEQLEQEVDETKQRLSAKKSKLTKLQDRLDALKEQKNTLQKSLDRLDDSADQFQKALSTHIQQTVPYERSKRRDALYAADSDGENPDPPTRLRTLTDAARNELGDGTTSELLHRRVPLTNSDNPRKKHARLLRIGQNTLLYVTEDGKQSGYYVWKNDQWQVKQASSDQAVRFRHAIDVLRGQRQPERISLPVLIPTTKP